MNRGALIASVGLHGGLAALMLWGASEPADPPRPPPVPVTLVTAGAVQGSPADAPAAEAVAPEFAPEPAPEAPGPPAPTPPEPQPPEPAPPEPQRQPPPRPAPPAPPQPAPAARPPAARPAPQRPAVQNPAPSTPAPQRPPPPRPAPPRSAAGEPSLDLDALSSRLARADPRAGGSSRGAPKQAPQAAGPTPAQLQAAGQQLGARLKEEWNPNCRVEGGDRINVRLRFRLQNGRVAGRPQVVGGPSSDPLVRAAEERAIRAVYALAPYDWLPEVMQNDDYEPFFNAEEACR